MKEHQQTDSQIFSPAAGISRIPTTFLATRSLHITQLPNFRSRAVTVASSPSDGTMMRWLGVVVKGTASSILSLLVDVFRSCAGKKCIWGSKVKSSILKDALVHMLGWHYRKHIQTHYYELVHCFFSVVDPKKSYDAVESLQFQQLVGFLLFHLDHFHRGIVCR